MKQTPRELLDKALREQKRLQKFVSLNAQRVDAQDVRRAFEQLKLVQARVRKYQLQVDHAS